MNSCDKQQYNEVPKQELPTKEEILSVLKEDEHVRNRIYNIRHGETDKTWDIPESQGLQ